MTIANDLRTECARILARHYGGIPDAIAAIRVSTVEKISAYVADAEDRADYYNDVARDERVSA